jgi:YidC/Oxa1 family membrane protein insertase
MDKKTLFAFSLIAVVLILTPWYMSFVSPPSALDQKTSEAPPFERVESGSPVLQKKTVGQTIKASRPLDLSDEKIVTINNGLFNVQLSNRGGGSFVSFTFNNYVRYDSALVDIIDELNKDNLILSFVSLEGDDVRLTNNWTPVNASSFVSADLRQQAVSYETVFNGEKIVKTFTFYPNSYEIELGLTFGNSTKYISRGQYHLSWSGGLAPSEKNLKDEYTHAKGYAYLGGELIEPGAPKERVSNEKQAGNTLWTAVKTKYFLAALIPETPGTGAEVSGTTKAGRPLYKTSLRQAVNSTNKLNLYIGPLDYKRIKALGFDLEKTMNLGWAIFRPLGQLVTWSLTKMYSLVPNYGVVVLLFAFLVKLLLNPLTKKQFSSQKSMQALQPQIKNLKEKYKNDPQKLSRAQMELFKERGVNPMGGCLPMLLQMPILISFFTIFRSTIEFRGAPFFGWITDLSAPDTITTIAGLPINILPFLMGITMFLQQKLMAAPDGGNQQKIMMYFMNVFFLFLFYTFPSGLNLYYSMFNLLSIIQQKYFIPDVAPPANNNGKPKKLK